MAGGAISPVNGFAESLSGLSDRGREHARHRERKCEHLSPEPRHGYPPDCLCFIMAPPPAPANPLGLSASQNAPDFGQIDLQGIKMAAGFTTAGTICIARFQPDPFCSASCSV